jgi:sugar/nucleoside kinase (ribokinase family)
MKHGKLLRNGIAAGGNWIVDRVKILDTLPDKGMLGNIRFEKRSTGGAPANVLADLARLKAPFPLSGVGIVGDDDDGRYILNTFTGLGIDTTNIIRTRKVGTSYTDVMTEQSTGERAFFHYRGANALFGPEHVAIKKLQCRIFHLGYLLLLDRMDERDARFGTVAARFLASLREQGIRTSVDVVSEQSNRFKRIVPPALKHVDYLILNEIEAGRTVGRAVRKKNGDLDSAALARVVDELSECGDMELIAVHMPEGVYIRDRDGKRFSLGSLKLPKGFIKSAVGAGDAFCAGMLYGLHEGWDHYKCARLGTCCAAASLSESGANEGVRHLAAVMKIGRMFPEKHPPVTV